MVRADPACTLTRTPRRPSAPGEAVPLCLRAAASAPAPCACACMRARVCVSRALLLALSLALALSCALAPGSTACSLPVGLFVVRPSACPPAPPSAHAKPHAAFVRHAAARTPGAHPGQRTCRWRDWLRALCGRTRRRTLGAVAAVVVVVAAAFSLQPGRIVATRTVAVVPLGGAGARLSRSVLSL